MAGRSPYRRTTRRSARSSSSSAAGAGAGAAASGPPAVGGPAPAPSVAAAAAAGGADPAASQMQVQMQMAAVMDTLASPTAYADSAAASVSRTASRAAAGGRTSYGSAGGAAAGMMTMAGPGASFLSDGAAAAAAGGGGGRRSLGGGHGHPHAGHVGGGNAGLMSLASPAFSLSLSAGRGGRSSLGAAAAAASGAGAAAAAVDGGVLGTAIPTAASAATTASAVAGQRGRNDNNNNDDNNDDADASIDMTAEQQTPQQNGGKGGVSGAGGGDLSYSSFSTAKDHARNASLTSGSQNNNNNNNNNNVNANADEMQRNQQQQQLESSSSISALRSLLTSTLSHIIPPSPLNCTTSSASTNGVFYGSLLYARTGLPSDAYLYARALAIHGEGRRAVWILDRAGLLGMPRRQVQQDQGQGQGQVQQGQNQPQQGQPQQQQQGQPSPTLRVEAALLASECLISAGEWDDASRLLEVVCCYPPPGHVEDQQQGQKQWQQQQQQQQQQGQALQQQQPNGGDGGSTEDNMMGEGGVGNESGNDHHDMADDHFGIDSHIVQHQIDTGDDARLDLLADLIRPSAATPAASASSTAASASASASASTPLTTSDVPPSLTHSIHPISRLSSLLAIVHDELGNPSRSATFLRASLRIDPRNAQALEHCLQRKIMDKDEERAMVLGLNFDGVPGGEFLRDIYLAKLGFAPADGSLGWGDGALDGGDAAAAGGGGGASEHDENVAGSETTTAAALASAKKDTTLSSPPGVILQQQTPNLTFLGGHGGGMNMDESSIRMEESQMMMMSPPSKTPGEQQQLQQDERKPAAVAAGGDHPANRAPLSPSDEINQSLSKLTSHPDLSSSSEILSLAAIHSYAKYDLPLTLSYCHLLEKVDPYCQNAAYVHISTLASLGYKRPLFQLAHRLVDSNPKAAKSWYAVGSYYYACGRYDLAQRHFCRAARLDPRSSECWIAFGCSFAACDESDQALASYRAASRLNPGDHYPLLYMGMEYVRTNHLSLAGHFLKSSWRVSGMSDPLVRSEMGVLHYRRGEWEDAVTCFVEAVRLVAEMVLGRDDGNSNLALGAEGCVDGTGITDVAVADDVENTPHGQGQQNKPPLSSVRFAKDTTAAGDVSTISHQLARRQMEPVVTSKKNVRDLSDVDCIQLCRDAYWEPTIFNLGQSYRKIRMFEEAAACFEKSLSICPGKASSYSALGYTRHLSGDLDGAIEAYHQSLSRKPDDPFCSEMLMRALNESLFFSHLDPFFDAAGTSHDESFLSGAGHGSGGASVLSPRGRAASAAASASFLSGHYSGRASTGGISAGGDFTFDSSNDVDMS